MAKRIDRKHRRVVAACVENVWAIEPLKLEQICGFLDLRSEGYRLTHEEVSATLGAQFAELGDEDDSDLFQVNDGVGHARMYGVLAPRMNMMMQFSGGTSTYQFASVIDRLAADDAVKTIVLEIDSPGGVMTGTEELRQSVAKARDKKRVVAVVRGMMCSAAYYVGSAATEIVATPSSQVGSIGVYMIHREISKMAEARGVKFRVFRAGEFKAADNDYEPLTDKMAARLQARVDAPYQQFLNAVAENRGISVADVESGFGQGDYFLADESLRRGMIDRIALYDDAIKAEYAALAQAATLDEDISQVPLVLAHEDISITVNKPGTVPEELTDQTAAAEAALDEGDSSMDPKLRAALVAKGFLSADATDEQAQATLNAGFTVRGEDRPEAVDAQVKAILGWGNVTPTKPADPVPSDTQDATLAERHRARDIRARGAAMGVSQDAIDAAEAEGISGDAAAARWAAQMVKDNPPATGTIETGESEVDRVFGAAEAVFGQRAGLGGDLPETARDMLSQHPAAIAQACVRAAGGRVTGDTEADALTFLQIGGTSRQSFTNGALGADGVSYNRAGDFPNIMSALAGKILDAGFEMADLTYPQWCGRASDAADLKPRSLIAAGVFDGLDEVLDDDMPLDLKLSEELMSWIQVDRYANKVGLTPVMVANDDMDAFTQQLQSLAYAHEATLNALCVAQLAGNPTMADGTALFAGITSDHYNLLASGTAVSSTALATMREKHRLQPGVGTSKKIKVPPKICLVPPSQEEAALQALAPLAMFGDGPKVPVTDATINTSRGKLSVVVESDLLDYSAYSWYTLADPSVRRVIAYTFQRGYGRGGQRETWFENGRKTRYVAIEGRFAAAASSWRGAIKNPYTGS